MLAERVEVRVEARERDQRGLDAAVEWHRDQQPPAGAQHATDLEQQVRRIGDVLEHLRAPHEVDARVVERQRAVGLHQPQVGTRGVAPRPLERRLRQLDAHGLRAGIAQGGDEPAGAAAEVEHALAGADLTEQQRAAPLPRPRLGILRCVGPEILVLAAHALEGTLSAGCACG